MYEWGLDGLHPESDIVLMEHDSVQKGEWDILMNRKSPYGFTQTNVIVFNGNLEGDLPSGVDETERIAYKQFIYTDEDLIDYPTTYKHKDEPLFGMGLVDCPIDYLDKIEDQRVNKRTWIFSRFYEESMRNFCDVSFHSSKKKFKKKNNKGFG